MHALALTFDDGPDDRYTPLLLDLLRSAEATATFFPIAPRAAAAPALIERMRREGHAIGLHCDQHQRHSSRDLSWCRADTARGLRRLNELGVRPTLWRTPWGDRAPWTAAIAHEHGLRLVGWSVDTHDWRGDGAASMFSHTQSKLGPGAIVLAHDGLGPGARRRSVEETLAYVEQVTEYARRQRIPLRSLS